jgi:autotransporter-associated beta strand protein
MLTFSVVGSGTPPGLTLSSSGVLMGVPTTAGSYVFQVKAMDMVGAATTRTFSLVISHPSTVYVDPSFTGTGDPATDPGLNLLVGANAFASIGAGLANVVTGGTLVVFGGTYIGPVFIGGPLAAIDVATNPSDSPVIANVTMVNGVTLATNTMFALQGVTTGTGSSTPAGLTFAAPVDGPGGLTVTGGAALGFDGPVGQLSPLSFLTDSASSTNFGTSSAFLVATGGDQLYNSPVSLSAPTTTFNVGGMNSSFNDGIAGSGANKVTKGGPGTLTMGGPNGNSYGGLTTVAGGTLILNEPGGPGARAVNGDLQINDGGALIDDQSDEISDSALVTVAGTSSLTLGNGVNEAIGSLFGTSSGSRAVLGRGSTLVTGAVGSAIFAGQISGPGALSKAGSATSFTLSGVNTYTGPTTVVGTLTVTGSLGTAAGAVSLTDPSSALTGNGSVLRPVIVAGTAVGARVAGSSSLTISAVGSTAIDVQAGANNVAIGNVTVTGSNVGFLLEPGSGNSTSITDSTFWANLTGLEVLNGCITATDNVVGGMAGQGNNVGVYIPAMNPDNPMLPVNPLLTLEGNQISFNGTGLQNASSMALTAILNWWGNSAGPGPVDGVGRNPVVGVNVNDYTPYALDAASAGPNPTAFDFFNGTGTDGNVYVTGTLGADDITATVDPMDENVVHLSGTNSGSYLRGGAGNRLILYSFGDNAPASKDVILVSGSWNAEIHSAALAYREPLTFSGLSSALITTQGTGSDVIFGGGNDSIQADTSGNNIIVSGLSTGRTGAPTAPRLSAGDGDNIFIAGSVDCALDAAAASGRLDYATLRSVDDLWATGLGGLTDAMSVAALFNMANTPGAILTGTARAIIVPGSGPSWFVVKGTRNPVNTPTGNNTDYVAGPTASPNYRQTIQ